MEEFLAQSHHSLAVLPPKILENLRVFDLNRWHSVEFAHQFGILRLSLADLVVLADQLSVHGCDLAVE